MSYDETMADCELGYDDLHIIQSPPESIPPDYVTVRSTCACGEITEFALHRYLLYHLMGRTGRMTCGPRATPYLRMLSELQADALLASMNESMNNSSMNEEVEDSPDR